MPELPKQVREQLDAAELLNAPPEAIEAPPVDEQQPPAEAQVADEPAEAVAAPDLEAQRLPSDEWEHKYRTLQGVLEGEQRRNRAANSELSAKLDAALTQIAGLSNERKIEEARRSSVTTEDVEKFGPEVVDLAKRIASDVVAEARAAWDIDRERLESTINTMRAQSTKDSLETKAVTQRQAYETSLTQQMPDFWAVNGDDGFQNWCRASDPITGEPRQLQLEGFVRAYDVQKTLNFFNAFKAAHPAKPAPKPASELGKQVTPSSTRATVPDTTSDATNKVWSVDEIDTFYRDLAKGKYRGNEGEAAAIEAKIDLATAQGRIKG